MTNKKDGNLQLQPCDLCGAKVICVQVSVTTGGSPGIFTVGENYWVCLGCSSTPIGDLVDRAFADRDAERGDPVKP